MRYLAAYFIGGMISMLIANSVWYPLPQWIDQLNGVQLGLLAAAVFQTGSIAACGLVAVVSERRES